MTGQITKIRGLLVAIAMTAYETVAQEAPVMGVGFPIPLETDAFATSEGPMLGDLDRDGKLEIIVASGRKVYVFRHDGTLLSGWPQATTFSTSNSPAVGDLDGDGFLDVITLDREGFTRRSYLYAWNHQGRLHSGFPLEPGFGSYAVTLYDLEGDGLLEIVGSFAEKIFVFHHDGTIARGWPQSIPDYYPLSKAAISDINADGQADIVVATQFKISHDRENTARGRLYVWNVSGELLPGWPINTPIGQDFRFRCNPALADVDQDGFIEIAVGTAGYGRRRPFAALYRYDGTMMPGWPIFVAGMDSLTSGFVAGPSVADIDADGDLELIFGDRFDHVVAWNADGSLVPGWPVILSAIDTALAFRSVFANPTIGDIDGDERLEIFATNNQADLVDGVWRGRIFALNHDGTNLTWSPLRPRQFASFNSVAMGDLDRDGSLELITVSEDIGIDETWLNVWTIPGVPYVEERFPWPMFGHDRWHTSQYGFKPPDEPTVGVKEREKRDQLPKDFALHQNYPNPFYAAGSSLRGSRNRTEISYELPVTSHVELRLFNLLGAEVRRLVEATQAASAHKTFWNGRDERGGALPAGIYFYRLEATPQNRNGERVSFIKKLLLVK